ncbi:MAG: hypothetical protein M4579_006480 [Chaenotheca gracillima]|nr:MAG: hypothetical protein M4579_006480 [Chaenotheca gracillima]
MPNHDNLSETIREATPTKAARREERQEHPSRSTSRSPHPYSSNRQDVVNPSPPNQPEGTSSTTLNGSSDDQRAALLNERYFSQSSGLRSPSESGTEADDESYGMLRGLPAPPSTQRKGLKDSKGGTLEATPSPLLTPAFLSDTGRRFSNEFAATTQQASPVKGKPTQEEIRAAADRFKRRRRAELIRRAVEVTFISSVGGLLLSNAQVWPLTRARSRELGYHAILILTLIMLYPIRIVLSTMFTKVSWKRLRRKLRIPSAFDPAPLLYPTSLPVFVALALLPVDKRLLLPNLVLSISALPTVLIPTGANSSGSSLEHWLLSMIPLFASSNTTLPSSYASQPTLDLARSPSQNPHIRGPSAEVLSALYPLHHIMLPVLSNLTTTSLLPAELQLLSISLINLLLHAASPQAVILQALLLGGGTSILLLCGQVLRWVVALSRIPQWRFRRAGRLIKARNTFLDALRPSRKTGRGASSLDGEQSDGDDDHVTEDGYIEVPAEVPTKVTTKNGRHPDKELQEKKANGQAFSVEWSKNQISTSKAPVTQFPGSLKFDGGPTGTKTIRRKRRASSSIQSYLGLTSGEARARKWIYAAYVYVMICLIVLVGIRWYVARYALHGNDPVGWAIGYLFGDSIWTRTFVKHYSLQDWICLPDSNERSTCHLGWVEHLRRDSFGEANTRLILCAYFLAVLTVGILIVLRLSSAVEVDSRRKVFHGMMVAMFLPTTFVDPAFASFALTLVLSLFLLLDLFRASQLPPLSRPLARFLTPYVDGRDLRGPVVVSHIFLLIGCAIPLWLSLAGVDRAGVDPWSGWDVTSRDVAMVSGVVCVGMGDAAASLTGRRYGRTKWLWSGGKSLEGSAAFALAVVIGLGFAHIWLVVGGWPHTSSNQWLLTLAKTVVAACGASLTEAVLTGGNDNVVVPVVLWLLVKGLDI